MCGIAGVVSATRESNITEALVRHMCDQIVHRGPDDEGILVQDGAGLGMRRLSIIDLAGGHQPVFNEDRTVESRQLIDAFVNTQTFRVVAEVNSQKELEEMKQNPKRNP